MPVVSFVVLISRPLCLSPLPESGYFSWELCNNLISVKISTQPAWLASLKRQRSGIIIINSWVNPIPKHFHHTETHFMLIRIHEDVLLPLFHDEFSRIQYGVSAKLKWIHRDIMYYEWISIFVWNFVEQNIYSIISDFKVK